MSERVTTEQAREVVESKLKHLSMVSQCALAADLLDARAELAEIHNTYVSIVTGPCAPDEVHCTCVPALRGEIERLKARPQPGGMNLQTALADFEVLFSAIDDLVERHDEGWPDAVEAAANRLRAALAPKPASEATCPTTGHDDCPICGPITPGDRGPAPPVCGSCGDARDEGGEVSAKIDPSTRRGGGGK